MTLSIFFRMCIGLWPSWTPVSTSPLFLAKVMASSSVILSVLYTWAYNGYQVYIYLVCFNKHLLAPFFMPGNCARQTLGVTDCCSLQKFKTSEGRHSVGNHRSVTNAMPKLCTRYCPCSSISTLAWKLKDCDCLLLIFVHLAPKM